MNAEPKDLPSLSDVAHEARAVHAGALDSVGMSDIALPVRVTGSDGAVTTVPARVAIAVDLQAAQARGIHMSRLYLLADQHLAGASLSRSVLDRLALDSLASHVGLSSRVMIRVSFEQLLRRPALASANAGWKSYPVVISAQRDGTGLRLECAFEVLYSSTCPCSAALARQLVQQQFQRDFAQDAPVDPARVLAWLGSEQGIVATPHAQRSGAVVRVRLTDAGDLSEIERLIDRVETALQTPVQTAVKREDEQAFARLNGQNLMFCEDAARRIQAALQDDSSVADFHIRATHYESLHPHDAVAVATKGIAGGYRADSDGWSDIRR